MKTIISIFLFIVVAAEAGWNPSAWPATNYPRMGATNILDLYNAVNERSQAALQWGVTPTAPTFYRLNKSLLENYKSCVGSLLTKIYPGNLEFTQQFIDDSSHTGSILSGTAITNLTATGLCVRLRLPTNYLNYTPWRCLNGVGPFTNDTTVGHGYGWTNEYTAAGGTNFPAGRTNWYTTDYGYDGLRMMVTNLRAYALKERADQNFNMLFIRTTATNIYPNCGGFGVGGGSGGGYPDALAACKGNLATGMVSFVDGGTQMTQPIRMSYYWANRGGGTTEVYLSTSERFSFVPELAEVMTDLIATTRLSRCDVYAGWQTTNIFHAVEKEFLSYTNYVLWESIPAASSNRIYGASIFPNMDNAEPTALDYNNAAAHGAPVLRQGAVLVFDFVYK
jgi:hypothetical protein